MPSTCELCKRVTFTVAFIVCEHNFCAECIDAFDFCPECEDPCDVMVGTIPKPR